MLTSEQLTDLCFPSRVAGTHRLVLLTRLGILDRFRPFTFTGSSPYHYVLGELGAQVLAAERGQSVGEFGYSRTVEFFLEWDTGTETLAKVAAKLRGYADLAAGSGIWTPTLLWLPSPVREAEIRRAIATPPVPVATAHGHPTDPSAAVWLPTGTHTRRVRLAALATRGDR